MSRWVKGELKEHWLVWLGLIGLAVIGTLMMICAGQHGTTAYIRMNTLLLCFIGWSLTWLGIYLAQQQEKHENRNKHKR